MDSEYMKLQREGIEQAYCSILPYPYKYIYIGGYKGTLEFYGKIEHQEKCSIMEHIEKTSINRGSTQCRRRIVTSVKIKKNVAKKIYAGCNSRTCPDCKPVKIKEDVEVYTYVLFKNDNPWYTLIVPKDKLSLVRRNISNNKGDCLTIPYSEELVVVISTFFSKADIRKFGVRNEKGISGLIYIPQDQIQDFLTKCFNHIPENSWISLSDRLVDIKKNLMEIREVNTIERYQDDESIYVQVKDTEQLNNAIESLNLGSKNSITFVIPDFGSDECKIFWLQSSLALNALFDKDEIKKIESMRERAHRRMERKTSVKN